MKTTENAAVTLFSSLKAVWVECKQGEALFFAEPPTLRWRWGNPTEPLPSQGYNTAAQGWKIFPAHLPASPKIRKALWISCK